MCVCGKVLSQPTNQPTLLTLPTNHYSNHNPNANATTYLYLYLPIQHIRTRSECVNEARKDREYADSRASDSVFG